MKVLLTLSVADLCSPLGPHPRMTMVSGTADQRTTMTSGTTDQRTTMVSGTTIYRAEDYMLLKQCTTLHHVTAPNFTAMVMYLVTLPCQCTTSLYQLSSRRCSTSLYDITVSGKR